MSSRIHGRGQKILDLCKNKEDQEITKEPEPSYISISEASLVQNVEFDYIRLDGLALNQIRIYFNLLMTIKIIIFIKKKKVNSKTTICFPFYL